MGYGLTQTGGNKNVIALYDDSGVQVAGYSYGPFGQLLSASGPLAQINPLRFSSEYFDDETGLVYYNYRYYSPSLGRWLSRDPIGEDGGLNLYGMLSNDAVNAWDKLGLALYAVDGTIHGKGSGSTVERLFGMSREKPRRYWPGPKFPVTGGDSFLIVEKVKKAICSDYCKNSSIKINMMGWSRGAMIILQVANALKKHGCCCNKKIKYPKINWMGLFDSVDMTLFDTSTVIPDNVIMVTHVIKSEDQSIFPTTKISVQDERLTNLTIISIPNSIHSDIGGPLDNSTDNIYNNWNSFQKMLDAARKAGVQL